RRPIVDRGEHAHGARLHPRDESRGWRGRVAQSGASPHLRRMRVSAVVLAACIGTRLSAQDTPAASAAAAVPTLLVPARVFDGVNSQVHDGWTVLVRGNRIDAVGPSSQVSAPPGAMTIRLPGLTLMPGLIEAHSHLLLHPYNETPWDEQ